jgi:short-subunit dehydrogenase
MSRGGDYAGQGVVITGAASGLGAALAELFASAGARLALLDIDAERVTAKAAEFADRGVEAIGLAVDVSDRAAIAAAAARVGSELGDCAVLCANVGVQQFGALDRFTADDWAWMLSVNVMGVVNTVAAFLPLIRASAGERHILLTGSASCLVPTVRLGAYVASKCAVVGYGEVLRLELAEEGINVTMLMPAGMPTRHLESSVAARPAGLGPAPFDPTDLDAVIAGSAGMAEMMAPEQAVRNLIEALSERPAYFITHGGYRDVLLARHAALMRAFDRAST